MESFLVSARKYRPDTFEAVVGQSHITNTLKNALTTGQLAHAFLFSGPRGVGKTTCARILAKSINCQNLSEAGDPCNECASCASFLDGRNMNIHELDAASNNSVEDIRRIIEQVRYVPSGGGKSVFIIDEVHMLSQAAFNAFLKTLEEPPAHAVFIMATTEKHKILPTILSRVQKFDFRRIKVDDIAEHLKNICDQESIQYEFEGLQLIALKADGALRDALSIFDQIVSFSNKNITYAIVLENLNVLDYDYFFKTVELMLVQDHQEMLLLLNKIVDLGFEAKDFMIGLTEHFRNLLIMRTPKTAGLLETSDNVKRQYAEQCQKVSPTLLLNAFQVCSDADQKMRAANNPRLLIELTLMKLAYLQNAVDLAKLETEGKKKSLAEKVDRVKEQGATYETENQGDAPIEKPSEKLLKKERRVYSSGFSIPKSLEDVSLEYDKSNQEEEEESEGERFGLDESIKIDEASFFKAYEEIKNRLYDQGQKTLSSTLKKANVRLEFNKWVQVVNSEHGKKVLEIEKDIVAEMRAKTGISNLFLEIEVNEMVKPEDDRPYTNQEKLEQMLKKNPHLADFMKKFDTMMDYR